MTTRETTKTRFVVTEYSIFLLRLNNLETLTNERSDRTIDMIKLIKVVRKNDNDRIHRKHIRSLYTMVGASYVCPHKEEI